AAAATAPPTAAAAPPARPDATGTLLMLGAAASNQLGSGVAALAFGVLGPVGVVVVRQWVAGVLLLLLTRPRLRELTWSQWWPVGLLALAVATMNMSLYGSVDRVGLGTAVTLEFLGPLGVALVRSRRAVDLLCALLAGAGVVVLVRPQPTTDLLGVGLGLLAAACWAAYIVLNRVIGTRVPGATGPAAAAVLSALAFVPVGVVLLPRLEPTLLSVVCAATAGLLASAVPFVLDLLALRRVPAGYFGLFMSVHPVLAALVGLVVLQQVLPWTGWLGIACVVVANTVAGVVGGTGRRRAARAARVADREAESVGAQAEAMGGQVEASGAQAEAASPRKVRR
ncbi:EamA family transporter, partial [Aquipuribacter hungaricus]